MLTSKLYRGLKVTQTLVMITRNSGIASDPVQELFLQKLRDYRQKSAGGQLVDPSSDILKEMKTDLTKLETMFGGGPGVDMTAFPDFKFEEPKLDPIDEIIPVTKQVAKKK